MLCGEQRSFWKECMLCMSDLAARMSQRLLAAGEVSQALRSLQDGQSCSKEGSEFPQSVQERLHAERWNSSDLDMKQQFNELSLFGQAP